MERMGYNVELVESSKELTARERVKIKKIDAAIPIDSVVDVDKPLVIAPDSYAVLDVHNEKSDNKDYRKYVIVDKTGNLYTTGSGSLWTSFREIFDEMAVEPDEYEIEIYKKESKNYKGKHFLTCTIL